MKTINYFTLYNYLIDNEKFNKITALRTIWRVRRLPNEYKIAVLEIIAGNSPHLECEGITLNKLVNEEDMSPLAGVLFLDWFRREPFEASKFMEHERFRTPFEQLEEAELNVAQEAIEKLKQQGIKTTVEIPEDHLSQEDIEINN